MSDKIKKGDIVDIHWEYMPSELNCEVLHTPCATGDSWRFKREDGVIIYVNSFSKMVKLNKRNK